MQRTCLAFIAIGLFLSACWEKADVPLPVEGQKMALGAFISPEDTFRMSLIRVEPIQAQLPEEPSYILNALVFLSDGQDTTQLISDPDFSNLYTIPNGQLPIRAGRRYWLWASAPGYPAIQASCEIPSYRLSSQGVLSALTPYTGGNGENLLSSSHTWIDKAGEKNFYRLSQWLIDSNRVTQRIQDRQLSAGAAELVSDSELDGQRLEQIQNQIFMEPRSSDFDRFLQLYILTTDEAYYRYHRSVMNYSGDVPFGNQENVYTNVKGGVGIFAGYRKDIKRVPVPQ